MHIGIVGPCSCGPLMEFLSGSAAGLNMGWGAASVGELVRGLLALGHRVSVVTLSAELTERKILRGSRLTVYVYRMRNNRRMRDLYKAERQGLLEGITLANPDILHAHWTYEFALACLDTGLPTLVTCRDNAFRVLRYSKDLYRLGRLYLQLRVLRRAQYLTAVSPYLAKSLRWFSRNQIEVIPNAMMAIPEHCARPNMISGPIRIATVLNGWGNLKNPKTAIRAFTLLRRHLPDAEMFMYGVDFEEGGMANQWTIKHGVAENIHFCGPRPRISLFRELSKMSILLHPALEESFGMAILEAMSLGVPVVAGFRSGAVQWVLDSGRAGFLTDVKSPEAIVETLFKCINQENERETRRANAFERAQSVFSLDVVARQYEKVYEKILISHAVRAA